MGFRCPICNKDFKRNKMEWLQHVKTEHNGAGEDAVKILKNITGKSKEDKK